MAKCYNRNDPGYQALKDEFGTNLRTSKIINDWQIVNDSDVFPSVIQAQTMVKDQGIALSLKKQAFGQSVLDNLRREKIGSNLAGQFLINDLILILNHMMKLF